MNLYGMVARQLLIGKFSVKRLIGSIVLVYVSLLLCVYFYSDRMIFQPQRSTYEDGPEILKIEMEDGAHLSALYLADAHAEFTILHSHGNAEDLGGVRPLLEIFRKQGFSVFAYDYRGYGTSEGTPSEKNAYRDVEAAYKYLVETLEVPPKRIIAYGQSLGGALAIHLACREQIAGLILESSFVTAFRVITRVPLAPFDKFRNIDKIKHVQCPVLVIHGKDDQIVPLWHGQRLFDQANEPKLHLWVTDAGHNDVIWVDSTRYWDMIKEFVRIIRRDGSRVGDVGSK